MDMSKFIVAKSDQLNSDDLVGSPRTITVTGVRGTDASDQPVAVSYEGDDGKPYKPCKSMRRVMVHCWGKNATEYAGRSMTLYCDPDVQFGGMKVGGIRISHMSHITGKKQFALTATRGKKAPYTVLPLTAAPKHAGDEGLQQAEALILEAVAAGSAALEAAWKAKGMEPHRDALRPKLDGWKRDAAQADYNITASEVVAGAPVATGDDFAPQSGGGDYDGV